MSFVETSEARIGLGSDTARFDQPAVSFHKTPSFAFRVQRSSDIRIMADIVAWASTNDQIRTRNARLIGNTVGVWNPCRPTRGVSLLQDMRAYACTGRQNKMPCGNQLSARRIANRRTL